MMWSKPFSVSTMGMATDRDKRGQLYAQVTQEETTIHDKPWAIGQMRYRIGLNLECQSKSEDI
jgi:hypothetical protein